MAKPKPSTTTHEHPSKRKTSIFLCCFGSSHAMESPPTKGSDPVSKTKKKATIARWFSRLRFRFNKNSPYKTVPFEHSINSDQANHSKTKSKSTLHHNTQAPATTNPPPPLPQPAPLLPATPYYTPTQTRHGGKSNIEDTRQQGRGSPAHAKLQARRLPSTSVETKTTIRKARNDGVVGMSVVVVTLVIMIFWGRLCAILCTSVWLYCAPRLRKSGGVNDNGDPRKTRSYNVDLDSEEYKKKSCDGEKLAKVVWWRHCHDLLETPSVREKIEKDVSGSAGGERCRRSRPGE
ncbi:unnamed protein product [Sphenostylis stenocarpa]|uniref:Uncharacterized protein n=1 Tax=Sphenostylis stenocarpa TaxID=92480 RepID=A0AA86S4D7_9FABA|nr:unnamed protein product [Sphenostylis stenocarpa]